MANQGEESIASEVLAASLGGALSASILYPLEGSHLIFCIRDDRIHVKFSLFPPFSIVLKTKMQASQDEATEKMDMLEFARYLIENYGPRVFWVGVETSALQSASEKALYFFSYTALKSLYQSLYNSGPISTLPNLLLGCAAEWCHLPITLPIDAWTTAIQTNTTGENAMTLLCNMLSEKGMNGMYKGIQAYVVLCFKPAIQYTVFEQVKRILLKGKSRKTLTAAESFLLGMVARTVATVVVFPYVRAKVMMQTAKEREETTSIVALLTKIYQEQGLKGWFQGLGPELTRGIFSAALMLMIKEQIADVVHTALYGNKSVEGNMGVAIKR